MGFLADTEIHGLIEADPSIVPALKGKPLSGGPVQPGSIDLSVGELFVPGSTDNALGGSNRPRRSLTLKQGRTAIIRTKEKLKFPSIMGGIAFPPASLSLKGLLTTNPGHVDPGYEGHLHLTVINMGKEAIELSVGMRIMRLLPYTMDKPACAPFAYRNPDPINEELLARLSPDFLDISDRAKEAATKQLNKSQFFQSYGVPVLAAIIAAAGTFGSTFLLQNDEATESIAQVETRLDRLEARIGGLGGNVNLDNVEDRLERLENRPE